ncbi:MAG: class I SAM-dependent methyltransferase [Verrucomicrobiota bacterium]|nr:class I SAM-dependent methyltransferase [Verrucomicrobiota bacterium]
MSQQSTAAAFAEHGTWISRFVIDGIAYGGTFDAVNDTRIVQFWQALPNARTILELGSLEGGHTIGLARQPGVKRVLGIEGREKNLARARLAARLMQARKVEFARADLETTDLKQFGTFDAVFCSGLLYHLPEPWNLLRQFPAISPHLFLWTHYCADEHADVSVPEYRGRMHLESGIDEPLSGLSADSFWPTLGSLIKMLTVTGFKSVHILENDIKHPEGPAVTIAAFTENKVASRPLRWWRR